MARPAKSVKTKSGVITKAEEAARKKAEDAIRGDDADLHPPEWLTADQAEIFAYIRDALKESKILGNLDIYILENAAVAIDRLRMVESEVNKAPDTPELKALLLIREKYSRDFFRCCNELCLSPQSRAKIAINAAESVKDHKKTLMDILNEDGADE